MVLQSLQGLWQATRVMQKQKQKNDLHANRIKDVKHLCELDLIFYLQ